MPAFITRFFEVHETMAQAIDEAERIFNETSGLAHIVVEQTDEALMGGKSAGVFCAGCEDGAIPGVRWPTAANGDESRAWVERCDTCARYDCDEDAASRVEELYRDTEATVRRGRAKPAGSNSSTPYVEVTPALSAQAKQVLGAALERADRRAAATPRVDYDALNKMVRRQRAALTRAVNSGDRDKVVLAVRDAVREWNQPGVMWPDDWARWQCALDDALPFHQQVDIADLG